MIQQNKYNKKFMLVFDWSIPRGVTEKIFLDNNGFALKVSNDDDN